MTHDRAVQSISSAEGVATSLTRDCLEAELSLRKAGHQGVLTPDGQKPDFVMVDEATGCVLQTNVPYGDYVLYALAVEMTAGYMATTEVAPGVTIQAALERVARP